MNMDCRPRPHPQNEPIYAVCMCVFCEQNTPTKQCEKLLHIHIYSNYMTLIEVHEMHSQMHPPIIKVI